MLFKEKRDVVPLVDPTNFDTLRTVIRPCSFVAYIEKEHDAKANILFIYGLLYYFGQ